MNYNIFSLLSQESENKQYKKKDIFNVFEDNHLMFHKKPCYYLTKSLHLNFPELTPNIIFQNFLSFISYPLAYYSKISTFPDTKSKGFSPCIFSLSEAPSGSNKSGFFSFFLDSLNKSFSKKNREVCEIHKDSFNTKLSTPCNDVTIAGFQSFLQKNHLSVGFLYGTEKNTIRSLFNGPTSGDHAILQYMWLGENCDVFRATRDFKKRVVWGGLTCLSQQGVLKDFFKAVDDDGLIMRCLISPNDHVFTSAKVVDKKQYFEMHNQLLKSEKNLENFYDFILSLVPLEKSHSYFDELWNNLPSISFEEKASDFFIQILNDSYLIAFQKENENSLVEASYARKSPLHIMKIAFNLFIFDTFFENKNLLLKRENLKIPLEYLEFADEIFRIFFTEFCLFFEKEELSGYSLEEKIVFNELQKSMHKTGVSLNMLSKILQSRNPFRNSVSISPYVKSKNLITKMLIEGKLIQKEKNKLFLNHDFDWEK